MADPNPFEPPKAAAAPGGNAWLKWLAPLIIIAIVALLAWRSWRQEPPEDEKDCVGRCVRNNLQIPEDEPMVRESCVEMCKEFQRGDLARQPSLFRERD